MKSNCLHQLNILVWRGGTVVVWLCGVLLIGCTWPGQSVAQDYAEINREYAIKAAYLYQFSRYVEWPQSSFADKNTPLVIGVLGSAPFGDILEDIARTKRVEGRPVAVRYFASVAEYQPCQVLFISASVPPEQTIAAIERVGREPVLLVGERPGFIEHGGMVNFFIEDNKVRFEISSEAVKRQQPKISSKLLSVAKITEYH